MKFNLMTNNIFLSLLIFQCNLFAQESVSEGGIRIPSININAGFHDPGADLEDRFGSSFMLGVGFQYKYENNFYLGVEASALLGSEVKESKAFEIITVDDGDVVDLNGNIATVRMWERGGHGQLILGKIFPVLGPNENSGVFFQIGVGYLFHKIRIEDIGNLTPPLNDHMKKGYDRLCMGYTSSQMIGYRHFSNNRKINFYVGVEFIQAFTEDVRAYDYNMQSAYRDKRLDLLNGLKFGWTLPLFQKKDNQYYYH